MKEVFPIFQYHPDLIYLDSAATTQKPRVVIEVIDDFYRKGNANVHRGLYPMAARTSQQYEQVREKVAGFIHATSPEEIVYTSGTTAGINLVAQSFLAPHFIAGSEIIITAMEHHANLIPWQQLAIQKGGQLRIAPIDATGTLDMEAFENLLSEKTAMVAFTHISNTLGTINPVKKLVELIRNFRPDIPVLIDAAQSAAHYPLDVSDLDVDFLVFSGHKLFGPTGIGILYGKKQHLESMNPLVFGGDMIKNVGFEKTVFAESPRRFEAGTTNIAGVLGLGAAIDFVQSLDRKVLRAQLKELHDLAVAGLSEISGLKVIGTAAEKSAIVSFVLDQAHPHDIASFLGAENIAIRAGHHCTQPLMDAWDLPGTIRASFSIYNTEQDVQRLVQSVKQIAAFFGTV